MCTVLWIAAVEKVESADAQDSLGMQEEEEETLGDKFYDKTKCFFDNISSELKPRWVFKLCCFCSHMRLSCSAVSNLL